MMLKKNPERELLRQYVEFYHVGESDPELMGIYAGFDTHASFHHDYLQEMLQERYRRLCYSKVNPGPVAEQHYLEQLVLRTDSDPPHLASFREFVLLCRKINELTNPPAKQPPPEGST